MKKFFLTNILYNYHKISKQNCLVFCLTGSQCDRLQLVLSVIDCTCFIQLMSSLSIKDAHVLVLSSAFTSEYKSEIPTSDMNPPFMRALKTVQFLGTPLAPYLEQPNVATGLPAQGKRHTFLLQYICILDFDQRGLLLMRCNGFNSDAQKKCVITAQKSVIILLHVYQSMKEILVKVKQDTDNMRIFSHCLKI